MRAVVTEILLSNYSAERARRVIICLDCYDVSNSIVLVNEGFVKTFIILSDQLAVTVVDVAFEYAVINIFFYGYSAHTIILVRRCSARTVHHLFHSGFIVLDTLCKDFPVDRVFFILYPFISVVGIFGFCLFRTVDLIRITIYCVIRQRIVRLLQVSDLACYVFAGFVKVKRSGLIPYTIPALFSISSEFLAFMYLLMSGS